MMLLLPGVQDSPECQCTAEVSLLAVGGLTAAGAAAGDQSLQLEPGQGQQAAPQRDLPPMRCADTVHC
jgi:hypothetical protein